MSILAPTNVGVRLKYQDDWVSGSALSYSGCVDWRIARSASPTYPLTDVINSAAKVSEYFNAANAAFNDTPFSLYIPLAEANYWRMALRIYNGTGVSLSITPYLVTGNDNPAGVGIMAAGAYMAVGGSKAPYTVANGADWYLAVGAQGDALDANRVITDWIGGGVVLVIDPVGDATTGQIIITCMRAGG